MKLFQKGIFLLFLILFAMISCKKEKDEIFPTVSITSPQSGQMISVDSALIVRASVSDNQNVESVVLRLYDNLNQQYVNGSKTVYVNKPSADLVIFYEVAENFISSRYTIELSVSDGENTKIESVEVRLNYRGYAYEGTVLASSSANSTALYLYNTDGTVNNFAQKSVSCAGIAINKRSEDYIILQRLFPVISAYSIIDNSLQWSKQLSQSGGTFEFSKLREINEVLYCLNFQNQIYKFDLNGNAQGIINTIHQPIDIKKIGNYLYTLEKRLNDQTYYLGQYGITGALISNRELNMAAVGLGKSGGNNVYILGNVNGKGRLMEYKFASGAMNFIADFNYSISSCFSYSYRLYFNSTENGNLYEYSLNLTDGIIKSRNVYADDFYIDEGSNTCIYNHFQNGKAYALDLNSFTDSQISTLPNKVVGFSAYYKK